MSFNDQVQTLAITVMRDPTASPEDRRAARAALVDDKAAAVSELRGVTARLTPSDRAAVMRYVALLADPNASYDPPAPPVMTVRDHMLAIAALDPELVELRRLCAIDQQVSELDQ